MNRTFLKDIWMKSVSIRKRENIGHIGEKCWGFLNSCTLLFLREEGMYEEADDSGRGEIGMQRP